VNDLTSARWDRIVSVFEAALALPNAERAGWIARACGDDGCARGEVEAMLAAHDDRGQLRIEARLFPTDAVAPTSSLAPGARIGSYLIDALVGEGGMGEVYRAERIDGEYRQTVALKVLRAGFRSAELWKRFQRERQILAQLVHPGIVPILDGGQTPDGRPYLVMQYVEGLAITAYCAKHALPLEARLRLFCQVANAVQFAHSRLTVHRDLKPSNILVDAAGRAHLVDFGIAKVLSDHEDADRLEETQSLVRLLTPDYAAPEQIRGGPITTATDVYALGVLLFQLLTDRRPYPLEARGLHLERAILEQDVPPPSSVVTDRAASRRLRGDLDRIVLMALRKEPDRRYATVLQLSTDIVRHLDGLPVSARPDRWAYRAQKFVRRHRAAVAGATGLAILLIGFAVASHMQSARISAERDRAQKLAGFLTQVFELSDPGAMRGQAITAREMLDSTARRADAELGNDPATHADVLEAIARAYHGLGLYSRSRDLLHSALAIRRTLGEGDDPATATVLDELADRALDLGDIRTSLQLGREAVAMRERLHGDMDARTIHSRNTVANALRAYGEPRAAVAMFERTLAMARAALGEHHRDVADALLGLSQCYAALSDHAKAESASRRALELHTQLTGAGTTASVRARTIRAQSHLSQRRYAEAEPLFRANVDDIGNLFGVHHPHYAGMLTNLAELLQAKGYYREAEAQLRHAVSLFAAGGASQARQESRVVAALGRLLLDSGRPADAEPLLRRALGLQEAVHAPTHHLIAEVRSDLGAALTALGRVDEARPLVEGGYASLVESVGPDKPETLRARQHLDRLTASTSRPLASPTRVTASRDHR
jgi:serine/threonine protein kinase/tetratricopeptide (TPR) repeat protein